MRRLGRAIDDDERRERVLGVFAPVSVLVLLMAWATQQVVGFGLIWWGLGGIDGADGLFDSLYLSGVVYFTLGFGEVVPVEAVPRIGALIEAFSGVLTTALVIGYLPALYSAYSERERKLMTLDDGTEDRITPGSLVMSRAPTGDVRDLFRFFAKWEDWIAGVLETRTTFPMLVFFRSKHRGQNWITALGVVTDAALICQMIRGAENREPYWMLRRSTRLFQEFTADVDLSNYRRDLDGFYESGELWREMYDVLSAHGFDLIPPDEARAMSLQHRRAFDASMEYLIDALDAPRGFWGHTINQPMAVRQEA